MPRKNAKPQKTTELDGKEFFIAIDMIEKEKGIPKSYMIEKITQALTSAYKKDPDVAGDNVVIEANDHVIVFLMDKRQLPQVEALFRADATWI